MPKLKFRQREETERIGVFFRDLHGADKDKLYKKARRLGDLDTSFHIILLRSGLEEYDRDIKAVAGSNLPDNETSICVLVDAPSKKKMNDAQSLALQRFSIWYDLPLKFYE